MKVLNPLDPDGPAEVDFVEPLGFSIGGPNRPSFEAAGGHFEPYDCDVQPSTVENRPDHFHGGSVGLMIRHVNL